MDLSHALLASHADRFWSYADTGGEGCWNWLRGRSKNGYGNFHPVSSVTVGAHRVAWALANGAGIRVGTGTQIDHRCNNRACVNPAHLVAATTSENIHAAKDGRTPQPLPSGCFKVRFRAERDGRIVQTSRTFNTEAEAWEFSASLKAAAGFAPRIAS